MITARRKLVLFGAIAVVLIYVGWDLMADISSPPPAVEAQPVSTPENSLQPSPTVASVADAPADMGSNRVTYAIAVNDLAGLSPTAGPGTLLDLWVAWDPPLIKRPDIRKLLQGVLLEKIAPPVTREGPYVALLSVTREQLEKLLWADRYGSISVAVPSGY